ncbi:MAG: chromate efflux transporter [Desulfocapsa sp.]|nr:chromate efflux transporter [Desulfocapsa sp.]
MINCTVTYADLVPFVSAFFRLGLTAFGGPAMSAYIRDLAVGRQGWLAKEAFQNGVALSQMIPGDTAMQVAAYVGLRVRGVRGAVVSYVGFGLPALIVAVVANATLSFGRTTLISWRHGVIALMAAAFFWLAVHPVLILLLAALLGMALHSRQAFPLQARTGAQTAASFRPLVCLIAIAAASFALLAFLSPALAHLTLLMSRIDLMAFGGGFASVPLMFHEVVEVHSWLAGSVFLDGIALGQFTPGPIVITATFVGYLLHGVVGACVATVAMFLPSLLLVIGVAPYFARLRVSLWFSRAISGVLCSFVGLLATVTVRFALQVQWDWLHLLLGVAALVALLWKIDILWVILGGAAISILFL